MEDDYNTEVYKGYTIRLTPDEEPINPRENYNLGTMIFFTRDYCLGDRNHGYIQGNYDGWDELIDDINRREGNVIMLPVWMYDHSGITISCKTNFSEYGGWDDSFIGYIYVPLSKLRAEFPIVERHKISKVTYATVIKPRKHVSKKLREYVIGLLQSEVEEYDQYLTGDVWSYQIFGPDDEDCEKPLCLVDNLYGMDYAFKDARATVSAMIAVKEVAHEKV